MSGAAADGRWVQPDWWGPPAGWFGGVLPIAPVVASNPRGAIVVRKLTVYPTGLAFDLNVLLRPRPAPTMDEEWLRAIPDDSPLTERPMLGAHIVEAPEPGERWERPVSVPEMARLAIEFDDERRAASDLPVGGPEPFTILEFQEGKAVHPDPELNVVLNSSGGSGGPDFRLEHYFLWPLPISGFRFIASWPEVGIEESSVEIDAATIAAGLFRARHAWA